MAPLQTSRFSHRRRLASAVTILLVRSARGDWASGAPNIDRDGGAFSHELINSPLDAASPAACFAICNATWGCAAWVFTPNTTAECPGGGANSTPLPRLAQCSLKYAVGNATRSNCSTSGFPQQWLAPAAHAAVGTASVRPARWLRDQMQLNADGMVGHLQDFFGEVQNSSWIGGNSDGGASYERAAYWVQGALPLAHMLNDSRLLSDVQRYVEYALAHAGNVSGVNLGWLGPDGDKNDARMYWVSLRRKIAPSRSRLTTTEKRRTTTLPLTHHRASTPSSGRSATTLRRRATGACRPPCSCTCAR